MPNHITNRVVLKGEKKEIGELLNSVGSVDRKIDFNKIVPIPEVLKDTEFHTGIISRAKNAVGYSTNENELLSSLEKSNRIRDCFSAIEKEDIDNLIKSITAFKETGFFYWYDWNINNWGTKWNAYETELNENILTFKTAWSSVPHLLKILSMKFPKIEIEYSYADEDTGSNSGFGMIRNGTSYVRAFDNQSRKAYEMAFELNPGNKEYYCLVDGEYVSKEDES